MTFLVIGATGKTGRPVAEALRAGGAKVCAAGRHLRCGEGGRGAMRGDWADRRTSESALDGAEALYVVGPFAEPDAEALPRPLLLSVRGAAAGREPRYEARAPEGTGRRTCGRPVPGSGRSLGSWHRST
ncbi:hypothetical protein [Streptomyces sp. NBC_01803]|uniref:hypothetical protein n=1 Tax=Streptomyces sp. NBC_01803 TaxID=2975946 RepID=UPI002DDA657E|nr:hypothetical protein [Streptomyces sp. NBC_01803]WSA45640.1 hypothetical protein OIE51_16385 [Streptomyces sp. NBC_01803]